MADGDQTADALEPKFMPSMAAAARVLKVTARTLRNWRTEGCPGFEPDGRVDVAQVAAWAEKKLADRRGTVDIREEKILEEIRRLRIANDAREGRLVERAWVGEKLLLAAGDLNSYRAKSEAEHAMLFSAAAGDPVECRVVLCTIWDEIMRVHAELAKHFEEDPR
jgi:hypothetical protein